MRIKQQNAIVIGGSIVAIAVVGFLAKKFDIFNLSPLVSLVTACVVVMYMASGQGIEIIRGVAGIRSHTTLCYVPVFQEFMFCSMIELVEDEDSKFYNILKIYRKLHLSAICVLLVIISGITYKYTATLIVLHRSAELIGIFAFIGAIIFKSIDLTIFNINYYGKIRTFLKLILSIAIFPVIFLNTLFLGFKIKLEN